MSRATRKPGELYWSLIEPIWRKVNILGDSDAYLEQFATVPRELGYLFACHWCQAEVRNGGFHQFFHNSTGVVAPEALLGFRAIGVLAWADALQQAMQFFGDPYPRERVDRMDLLIRSDVEGDPSDPFYSLNKQFHAWLRSDNARWDRAADAYARKIRK